jgi:DNA-directed RNA polymerase specialized sigma24 family protein
VSDYSFAGVDFGEVLERLVLYAQNLNVGLVCTGLDEKILTGGDSAEDLSMTVLQKFIDPLDASVAWSDQKGEPTTSKVVAYLKKVMRNDLFDLKKSKRFTTTIHSDLAGLDDGQDPAAPRPPQLAGTHDTLEAGVLKRERREWILGQFDGEPELKEILLLLLGPDGWKGFSNQQLSELLDISVRDVENSKKRIKLRLRKLAASRKMEGAKNV